MQGWWRLHLSFPSIRTARVPKVHLKFPLQKQTLCCASHRGGGQKIGLSGSCPDTGASDERDKDDHLDGRHEIENIGEHEEKNYWQNRQVKIKQVVSKRCRINRDHQKRDVALAVKRAARSGNRPNRLDANSSSSAFASHQSTRRTLIRAVFANGWYLARRSNAANRAAHGPCKGRHRNLLLERTWPFLTHINVKATDGG